MKVAMLISLVMAKSPSSLGLMTVLPDYFRQLEDSIEFVLVGLEKHSREDYVQEPVLLTRCEVSQLDPVSHVKEYMKRMAVNCFGQGST